MYLDKFLIVSQGNLTQTLWVTAALKLLRLHFPHAYIAIATNHQGEEVFKHSPHLNKLFALHKNPLFSWISLLRTLKKEKIHTALFFHKPPPWIYKLCPLLGISTLLETENKSLLDSLQLVEKLGAKCFDIQMELFLPSKKSPSSYLPLIGINPFTQKKFHQWPQENFIQLAKRLKDHLGCHILVIGSPQNRLATTHIASYIEGAEAVISPMSLEQMSLLIKKMSIYIVNDPDPLHLSLALNTPVLALLGHTDQRPLGTHFFYETTILQAKPTCFPCLKAKCPLSFCMRQLTVEEVFQQALQMFYRADSQLKYFL